MYFQTNKSLRIKGNYYKSSWLNLCYKLGQMEIAGEKKRCINSNI